MNDRISIIVSVYNIDQYIANCIRSILSQSYSNIEIILVDDGSTDRSGIICEAFAKLDKRITVIHKQNGGLSDARNFGIDYSHGSLLGFVDGDDEIDSNMYMEMYKALIVTEAQIAIAEIISISLSGKRQVEYHNNFTEYQVLSRDEAIYYLSAERKLSTCAWNKLYRKELFDNIRFPIGKIFEDKFVMHEIFYRCKRLTITHKAIYFYYQRPGSIIMSKFNVKKLEVLEAAEVRYKFYRDNQIRYANNVLADKCWQAITTYTYAIKGNANNKTVAFIMYNIRANLLYLIGCRQFTIKEKVYAVLKIIYYSIKNKVLLRF